MYSWLLNVCNGCIATQTIAILFPCCSARPCKYHTSHNNNNNKVNIDRDWRQHPNQQGKTTNMFSLSLNNRSEQSGPDCRNENRNIEYFLMKYFPAIVLLKLLKAVQLS